VFNDAFSHNNVKQSIDSGAFLSNYDHFSYKPQNIYFSPFSKFIYIQFEIIYLSFYVIIRFCMERYMAGHYTFMCTF